MKPVARLTGLGFSIPIPIDYKQNAFGIGMCGIPSSGGVLTWGVQHSFDDPGPDGERGVQVSQTTTVITVSNDRGLARLNAGAAYQYDLGHGLSAGDSVFLKSKVAGLQGHFPVATVVDAFTYTLTSPISQSASDFYATSNDFRWLNNATLVGQTGRLDGNYAFPPRLVRFVVSAYSNGFVDFFLVQGVG